MNRRPIPEVMKNPMFAAFIFDMDDTLVLSTPAWRRAEETILASVGVARTEELAAKYKGMNALDVSATIHRLLGLTTPLSPLQKQMRAELLRGFSELELEPVPGAQALVRRLQGLAPMAVASGSPAEAISGMMARLGLTDCFAKLISSESVARGKPHPDAFLASARLLGVPANRCLVFEDSLIGAQAARAAGMTAIVRNPSPVPELHTTATLLVSDWEQVTPATVAALYRGSEFHKNPCE